MEGTLSVVALLCLMLPAANAVTVTIPQTLYEVARGDNITIPCNFKTTDPTKLVLLEWLNQADQVSADENVVITYYPGDPIPDISTDYTGRVSLDMDVPSGKFNLILRSVTFSDSKKFKCLAQAKGDTSKSFASTTVLVLVAPSTPECKIQGKAEYGQNINLTCYSSEGSPAPTYSWQSRDVSNNPRPIDPKTTNGGILSLFNISKDTSGFFICTSQNKIRSATCNITLAVMPPSMNIGSTAGIVAGVAVFLLVLAIIVYCCCCRKKNKEEEYAMGEPEDEYHDKVLDKNKDGPGEVRRTENNYVKGAPDSRDEYEERSERGNDRRSDYDDRRSDYNDRRSDYDDRRKDYDDRRSDYDDRRSDYDDRRSDYSDRRDKYSDRQERYDDDRRYNDRRDRRQDDDRYDEPYDDRNRDRPPVPNNKPPRRN